MANQKKMPRLKELKKAEDIASTEAGANYLVKAFERTAKDNKLVEESQGMLRLLVANSKKIHNLRTSDNKPWDGIMVVMSPEQNAQRNTTKDIVAALAETVKDMKIHLDCAIGDSGEFIRKFSSQDGKELAEHIMQHLDNLLKSWFAENNIVIANDGHLYEGLDGKIKLDGKNNPIKVDPEQVRQLMNDEKKGFQQFMAKNNLQEPTVQQHKFPEQQPAATPSSINSPR